MKYQNCNVMENYRLGNLIGVGSCGEIYEAAPVQTTEEETSDNFQYAIKVLRRENRMNDSSSIATELEILGRLQHSNVIALVDSFESPKCVCLVLENARAGDLLTALINLPSYSECIVRDIIRQLFDAVEYIHNLGIVHRDIKMSNILCTSATNDKLQVKLADFGVSVQLSLLSQESPDSQEMDDSNPSCFNDTQLTTITGTRIYMAPEMHRRAYGRPADIWALGCVCVELLTGDIAFSAPERSSGVLDRLCSNVGRRPLRSFEKLPAWTYVPEAAKALIHQMLHPDSQKRITISNCRSQIWLSGARNPNSITNNWTSWLNRQRRKISQAVTPFSTPNSNVVPDQCQPDLASSNALLMVAFRILKHRQSGKRRQFAKLLHEKRLATIASSSKAICT
jgi:serine/threonine protein kinase